MKDFFDYETPEEKVAIDAAAILCIEPRFWNPSNGNGLSPIAAYMADQDFTFVPLTKAGGIKLLISDESSEASRRDAFLFDIEQELGLHHPRILIASVHMDCGGYGYSGAFGNDVEKERARLESDLRRAGELLQEKFGSRVEEIRLLIFAFDGVHQIEFAEAAAA